jgi:hypothetical protein
MFLLNGTPLGIDSPFTYNDTRYPSNWLRLASQEERAAIGITEVADAPWYDDRYYWSASNSKQLEDLTVTTEGGGESYVQKGLKSQHLAQTKVTANQLLSATDWMVIRKAERNVDIPAATVTYRAAVLAECDRLLAAIAAASDVPALMAVTAAWPESN